MTTKAQSADQMSARLAHLNMIQAIISRLATFSANAKNICITIEAAIFGVAFQQRLPLLVFAALFVLFAFGALDVYYLAQERRFREFYRDVQKRPLGDAGQLDLEPPKLTVGQYLSGIRSFSTGGFYLVLLIGTAVHLSIGYGGQNGVGKTGGAAVPSDVAATESKPIRKAERVGVSAERSVQNAAAVAEGRDVRQSLRPVNSNR